MTVHLARLAIALLASFGASVLPAAASAETRRDGALVYDGIPEIQGADPALARYGRTRTAFFQDWLEDGSMLILTSFGNVEQVHRVAAPGGARTQLTFGGEPVRSALAQPGTNRFLFSRDAGGNEAFQAYLGTGEGDAVLVTEPGTRNERFVFSPDGRLLSWSRLTPGQADADIMVMSPGEPSSRRAVYRGTGTVAPVDVHGNLVLVEQRQSILENQYLVVDLSSGRATRLLPDRSNASFRNGRFLEGGRRVAMTMIGEGGFRTLVMLDLGTGALTPLTPAARWDVELFDVDPEGRRIAYSVNEDGFSRVTIVDLRQPDRRTRVPVPDGMLFDLRFSPDGARIAIALSTATGGDVWCWEGGRVSRWTMSELGGLDRDRLAQPSLVRFPSFDGRSIPAFVYRPTGRADGRRPVIVSIHGGPEAQERTWFNPDYQYWTNELGAVVVAPNVRGSTGYGQDYLTLDDGLRREDAVRDVGAVLDWIATQPDLDPARVVVYGESYGGFMSLASLARYSDRLAGAIDVVGISHFATFLENTEGYRRDRRRAEYGDERDPAMRAFFDRISPINLVDRMRRPLLVVAGANDVRVPLGESQRIVSQIRANGGEAWLLVANDEGHGFQRRSNQLAKAQVQTMFLRRLFGLPPGGAARPR